jgi:2-haloacid dehalogenase
MVEASERSEAFCMSEGPHEVPAAVVFDIGRVLFDWNLRHLFAKLIADEAELEWFLANVVTEQWHFQSDAGRPLADMVPELVSRFPEHRLLIGAYVERFNETIANPVPGTHELVRKLSDAGVALFALTNFGAEFWRGFRPQQPIFNLFADVVVSGEEKTAKPEPRIYEIAETRFGLPGGRLFFTDDNPANVAAAAARGWHAHLFTDAAALEDKLVASGLLG